MFFRRLMFSLSVLLSLVMLFGFIAGLYFILRNIEGGGAHSVFVVGSLSGRSTAHDTLCDERDDIHTLTTSSDAARRGGEYFGGARSYDLSCAQDAYERAVTLDPKGSLLAWHQLGRIAFVRGDYDRALADFDKQITYFGDQLPNVHYMRGLTYAFRAEERGRADDFALAEREFERYVVLDPESPWARVDYAYVLFSEKKYDAMRPVLEEGLLRHPTNPWLLNMYGLSLLNTGDKEGARLYFTSAERVAKHLTVDEWGRAYPGNDPTLWPGALAHFQDIIAKNIVLASAGEG